MTQRKTAATAVRQPDPISEIRFCAWLAQAEPGDRLEYHRGYLAVDADKLTSKLDLNARAELVLLRDRAFGCEVQGLVHLVQERIGPDLFAYVAIARPHKGTATAAALKRLADAAA
jgi:hypothetical protein